MEIPDGVRFGGMRARSAKRLDFSEGGRTLLITYRNPSGAAIMLLDTVVVSARSRAVGAERKLADRLAEQCGLYRWTESSPAHF